MQFHKKIHHHIKKYHKKYLLGVSLSGAGFFILKFFILGTSLLSIFSEKNGVFALSSKSTIPAIPYVELNGQNIIQEPFSCGITAETCDLSNKNIVSIASGTFANHKNLTNLYLNNNKITSIEVGDFNGATNLESINLSNNPIFFIMTGSFDNFKYLYNLQLTTSCNNSQTSISTVNYYCSNDQYYSEYINQISCENAGYCTNYSGNNLTQFTGQTSCENNSCYNSSNTLLFQYKDQTSCENAGICYDYNGYIVNKYNNQTACESVTACYDGNYGIFLSGYTDQTSCENGGTCYSWNNKELSGYTDQTSCENSYTCSNNLYTDQTSCENGGTCYNSNGEIINYIDQISCENNHSCSNNLYTDQTSCENGGTCYDYNGNKLNYINSGSCTTLGLCEDYAGYYSYTDENSCKNAGACYNYKAQYPNEYTNEGSCIAVKHCYNSKAILLNEYTNESSCVTSGYLWTGNTRKYSWQENTWENGNIRGQNSRQQGNSRNQNYRYTNVWGGNYRQSNGNIWKPSIWNSYGYTWNSYINQISTTDNNFCSIIDSSTTSGFIANLTSNQYQFSGGYYRGNKPLKFTEGKNQIFAGIIMENGNSQVKIDSGTIITSNGQSYTGIIFGPTDFLTGNVVGIKNVVSLMEFGNPIDHIEFSKPITVKIPVTGKNTGDVVKIFYNNNLDNSWIFHTTATVLDDGRIEFTTNHATYFAIGEDIGSFVINNDDASTSSKNVTLTIYAPTAQKMKFANSTGELTSASWVSYNTTYPWTLSDGVGPKTVYAEFDTNGDDIAETSTSDNITLIDLIGGTDGTLKLEILGGTSECMYGTSLNLGTQDSDVNKSYTFTGTFPGDWYCMDYKGISSGRAFTIQTSNLSGSNGGVISGSNVWISHNTPFAEGNGCTGDVGTSSQFYSAGFTLMEKVSGYNNICKVTLSNVGLQINVPANTAPGDYQGVLTMTLPNGF